MEADQVIEKKLKIRNKLGIHARPASQIVKLAGRFESEITLEKDGASVSAKSIMGVLTLEGQCGAQLLVRAEGEDAKEAMDAITELIDNKFYEDE